MTSDGAAVRDAAVLVRLPPHSRSTTTGGSPPTANATSSSSSTLLLDRPATDPPARHRASDAATQRPLPLRLVPPPEGNLMMKVTSQAFRPCYIFPGLVARPVVVAHATAGRVVEPTRHPEAAPHAVPPTHYTSTDQLVHELPAVFRTGLVAQLKATLDLYVKRIMPTETESRAKRDLFNSFADFCFLGYGQRISMSVVGSTAYEADACGSDLDIVLLTNTGQPLWMLQNIEHTRQQLICMQPSPLPWLLRQSHVQVVDSARVPVLSLTTPSGLLCDISVNTLNSIRHTTYFKSVIEHNLSLRPLMRMLKYWAKARRLPTMREGGLPGIVWMILVVFYATCPLQSFLHLAVEGPDPEYPLTPDLQELLAACDHQAPVFGALFRFFRLCGWRKSLTRMINISKAQCIEKDYGEVADRVASLPNHHGVWDEVVSVEDPSSIPESAFNLPVRWTTASEAVSTTSSTGSSPPLGPGTGAAGQFEPGGPTDLAAKISAATWLVYVLELKRGSRILSKLMRFMRDTTTRVESLASAQLNPPYLSTAPAQAPAPSSTNQSQSAQEFIAQQFRQYLSFLFEESDSDRFVIPGCADRLRQLEDQLALQEHRRRCSGPSNKIDKRWESSAVSARGLDYSISRPFCGCCSKPKSDLAVVLLGQRLHVLKITSICPDWSTWWTRDFLSRRDVRSILHGTLHQIVRPEEYLPIIREETHPSQFFIDHLPPTGWPTSWHAAQRQSQLAEHEAAGRTPMPSILLPVRAADNSSPIDILFSPCNFVCRLKGWIIDEQPSADALLANEVYFLESDELSYLEALANTLKEAPWYSRSFIEPFQPAVPKCHPCNVEGEDLDTLKESADYDAEAGVFQAGPLPERTQEVVRLAWQRWSIHVKRSERTHRRSGSEQASSDASDTGTGAGQLQPQSRIDSQTQVPNQTQPNINQLPPPPPSPPPPPPPAGSEASSSSKSANMPLRTDRVLAGEFTKATALLSHAIERLHHEQRALAERALAATTSPATSVNVPASSTASKKPTSPLTVRRACSFPDSRTLMRGKREELELYIPPSKRALVEPSASPSQAATHSALEAQMPLPMSHQNHTQSLGQAHLTTGWSTSSVSPAPSASAGVNGNTVAGANAGGLNSSGMSAVVDDAKQMDQAAPSQAPPEPVNSSKKRRTRAQPGEPTKRRPGATAPNARAPNRPGRHRRCARGSDTPLEEHRPPEIGPPPRATLVTTSRLFSTALRGTLGPSFQSTGSAPDLGRPPVGD